MSRRFLFGHANVCLDLEKAPKVYAEERCKVISVAATETAHVGVKAHIYVGS